MKMISHTIFSLSLLMSFIPVLTSCGSDSKESPTSQTMVVEVGDGQPSLRLTEDGAATDSEGSVSTAEIKHCEDVFAGPVVGWKISGNQNQVDLSPTQAFATKITGNQNKLNLIIKAKEGETELVTFPGVCLVLGGNQASVTLTLQSVSLVNLKVVAKGNSGSLSITLADDAKIPDSAVDDLGKHVTVSVTESMEAK